MATPVSSRSLAQISSLVVISSVSSQPRNHLFQPPSEGGRPPVTKWISSASPLPVVSTPTTAVRFVPESIRSQTPTLGSPVVAS